MEPRPRFTRNSISRFRFHWLMPVFGLLHVYAAHSQFQQYRNYDVKDGLPSSEVYSMMQDAAGYLWFTTDMGASRFDGYQFKNYSTENGMPDNTVFASHEDHAGRIWFTSFSGKLCYYFRERISTLPCNTKLQGMLKDTMVSSIYVDRGDTIWLGTTKNVVIKIAPGWSDADLTRLEFPAGEGFLYLLDNVGFVYGGGLLARNSLSVYHRTKRKLYDVKLLADVVSFGIVRYSVSRVSDGSFLVTVNNSIVNFDSSGILSRRKMEAVGICTLEGNNGEILAGTYNGIYSWTDKTFSQQARIAMFNQKIVTDIFRDNENSLWYCTEGNGVWCVVHNNFLYYTPQDGLAESKISCVSASGNKVLTGHLDGTVSILDGISVTSMVPESNSAFPGLPNRIASILYVDENEAFLSTTNAFYTVNAQQRTSKLAMVSGCKKTISARDGNIWGIRFRNITKFERDGLTTLQEIPFNLFADNIYEDRTGKLWICAVNGLWTHDDAAGLVYHGKDNPLLASRIVDVAEATDGSIWMVSRGNGLIVKTGNVYNHITRDSGLAANMCRCVFVDSGNVAWVGTNNGLSRIAFSNDNGFTYSIASYSSQNGLLTNEVNSILRLGTKLWTVHTNGISVFEPSALHGDTSTPPVYITCTLVDGDTLQPGASQFAYDENYFNISFVGLSFRDPGRVTYRYKMEGVDTDWNTTSYTSVKYQTLPPGNYRFLVQASSNDGYWSQSPAVLSFVILPAWWQTWIFKTGVILFVLATLILLFRSRIKHIRSRDHRKAVLQNRIATFELNALRAQMNPHFVFNSINSVQYFITNNDPDSSQKYLSKFAKLIRYVVDNSKLASIPVRTEIEALTLYLELEALRFGSRLEYAIHVQPEVDQEYTQIPSMLIQPYVENAIWHGLMHKKGNGRIDVTLEMKSGIIHCSIEDNGIGRSKSLELKKENHAGVHKSVGMSNTRERLDIINQVNDSNMNVIITDLYDSAGVSSGTKVEILIPVA